MSFAIQPLFIPVRSDTSPSIRLSNQSIDGVRSVGLPPPLKATADHCGLGEGGQADPGRLEPAATGHEPNAGQSIDGTIAPDCGEPTLFNDRELSFLRFQERVFEEAQDDSAPLLERVKFVAIAGTHLDDFVRVRASQLRSNAARRLVVESMVKSLLYDLEVYWRRRLLPALRRAGVHIVDYKRLTAEERSEVDCHFGDVVRPLLSPLAYDSPRPLPQIASLGMNLVITAVDGSGDEHFFVLRIPEAASSLLPFHIWSAPAATTGDEAERRVPHGYVWLDQVVLAHLPSLFPDMRVVAAHRFRLLRQVDVELRSPEHASPIERVEELLRLRRTNPVVTLVADRRMSARALAYLTKGLEVSDSAVYRAGVVCDPRRLWDVTRIARPDLRTPYFVPKKPAALEGHSNLFAAARIRDVLFHHPYETFQPVVEMIQQAAGDPDVIRISMTLYRTDRESPVVQALLDAVRRGKQVRVLIELYARLDEHRNVSWWRMFEEAGAAVFAAPVGLKVHAKMALIERQEGERVGRYAHLSSGNYNAFTARAYTDLSLLTCDEDIAADIANLFEALCGGTGTSQFRALSVAPVAMRETLRGLVDREIACRRRGERGHIILKVNGLVDREVIQLLYRASQAGVDVDLLVRSICCLRPGVPGVSDRIRVCSIVGRFLEHSRVWYFRNGGHEEVYIGSADLMPRNLDRRIEIMAPLKDSTLRRRVFNILRTYLVDNVKARELQADGRYVRMKAGIGQLPVDAQLALLNEGPSADTAETRLSIGGRSRHLTLVRDSATE